MVMTMRKKLFGALLLVCIGNAWGLDANEAAGPSQEEFKTDFLVYSFTWQPTFCIMKPKTPGCEQPPKALLSHGLWPYSKSEGDKTNRHPQNCTSSPSCRNDVCTMPAEEMKTVLDNKPLRALVTKDPEGMFDHEWRKHGTCSGKTMQAYFQDMVVLAGVKKFEDEDSFKGLIGKKTLFSEIRKTFPDNTAFRCYRANGEQFLHEVFYLIDKDGHPYLDERNLQIGIQCQEQETWIPTGA
jgi:ribonuclease T2